MSLRLGFYCVIALMRARFKSTITDSMEIVSK